MTGLVGYIRDLLRWSDVPEKISYKRRRLDENIPPVSDNRSKLQKLIALDLDEEEYEYSRPSRRLSYVRQMQPKQASTSTPHIATNSRISQRDAMPSQAIEVPTGDEDEVQILEGLASNNVSHKSGLQEDVVVVEDDSDSEQVVYLGTKSKPTKMLSPNYSTFNQQLNRRHVILSPGSARTQTLTRTLNGAGVTKAYRRQTGKRPIQQWIADKLKEKEDGSHIDLEGKRLYQKLITDQIKESMINASFSRKRPGHTSSFITDSEVVCLDPDTTMPKRVIDPVNSLRDSLEGVSIAKKNWLEELDKKYEAKNKDLISQQLETTQKAASTLQKLREETSALILQYELKVSLDVPSALVASPIEAQAPVLPELTQQHLQLIDRVTRTNPHSVITEKFNLKITGADIQTLCGLKWLNDVIINYYMNLIMQRCNENANLPKTYATNTFFYERLLTSGHDGLKRWTKKVDIFAHDLMAIPVHLGVHWTMCLIYFKKKQIRYLDSMNSSNEECLKAVLQYLKNEHMHRKGTPLSDGWSMENCKKIPQQMNGSDCGVFSMTFAEFASRNQDFNFTQANMPYFRKKAIVEISQGKLLM